MKKLKYLFMIIISMSLLHSCLIDNETDVDLNDDGPELATFESFSINLTALANGDEYDKTIRIKVVGPGLRDLTTDVAVTVSASTASTAEEGVHYRIDNKTITLPANENFLGLLHITMITEGNSPPMDGTPEFEEYVAPVLILEIVEVAGNSDVIASGKAATITLNFTAPNPYEGDYDAHIIYRHPSMGEYPNNIYVDEVNQKTLVAVTGRKCETGFAIWYETDICWITVNVDNSITFEVWDTWTYEVLLGDPNDPSLISHFDPDTRVIYVYYHYFGEGGARIFWEVFTPLF